MDSKSQPTNIAPPDPNRLIGLQANLNRLDQFTPFGNLTFSGPDRNQATLGLSPGVQNIVDQQIGLDQSLLGLGNTALGGISSLVSNPLSAQNLPSLPSNFESFRGDTSRAFFDRSRDFLDEQFQLDEERLRQRLANQGLQVGGEAFGTELGLFNQRRGETFENLARDAVLFGGQESSRSLQDQLNLRNQALSQDAALRQNQFLELGNLLGLQQVQPAQLSSFFGPGQVNAIDPFSIQQNTLRNNFNVNASNAGASKGASAQLLGNLGVGLLDFFGNR